MAAVIKNINDAYVFSFQQAQEIGTVLPYGYKMNASNKNKGTLFLKYTKF